MKYRINNVNTNPRIPMGIGNNDSSTINRIYGGQKCFAFYLDLSAFRIGDKVESLKIKLRIRPFDTSSLSFIMKAKQVEGTYIHGNANSDSGQTIDEVAIQTSCETELTFEITNYIQEKIDNNETFAIINFYHNCVEQFELIIDTEDVEIKDIQDIILEGYAYKEANLFLKNQTISNSIGGAVVNFYYPLSLINIHLPCLSSDSKFLPIPFGMSYSKRFYNTTFDTYGVAGKGFSLSYIYKIRKMYKAHEEGRTYSNPITLDAFELENYQNIKTIYRKLSIEQEANKFYKQYTVEPIKGTNYYFLVIKFAEKADTKLYFEGDEDYEDATEADITASNALKAEIVEKMKKDLLTDNDVTRILFENRTKNGLAIYDRYLEAVYEYSYKKFFDTTIAVTNYLPFIKTEANSKTVVATIGLGDKKVEITADELFAALEEKYGVLTASSIVDDYMILNNTDYNDVYNPFTGEVIDEEAYKAALTSEIATIRKNFEYGYFQNASLEQYGLIPAFGADYGWNNFKEDYFSAFSDAELIANRDFGGSVYTEASNLFTKTLYANIDEVLATIKENYAKYYSVDVMNLVIYVDEDFDANPDTNIVTGKETGFEEESNWTAEQKAKAVELANLFVELAPQTGATTLTSQMSALVELYNKAMPVYGTQAPATAYDTVYTYNYFGQFKAAGLKLKWEDKATYTNTSSIVEEFHEKLKEIYDVIDGQGLVGETITAPYFSDVAFETSYGYHMIAVVGSKAPTELPSDEEAKAIIEKHLYISLTEDEQGEDHDKLAALTADEQSFITSWYTPATEEMGGSNPVSKALLALRTDDANLNLIKFENNENLERYKTISEILAKSYEEEE